MDEGATLGEGRSSLPQVSPRRAARPVLGDKGVEMIEPSVEAIDGAIVAGAHWGIDPPHSATLTREILKGALPGLYQQIREELETELLTDENVRRVAEHLYGYTAAEYTSYGNEKFLNGAREAIRAALGSSE